MGNLITNEKTGEYLQLSNGGTSVLMSVLLLSGSDLASTQWELDFVAWLAEHDHNLLGLGMSGFDLNDIAWTHGEFIEQKRFVLKVIHRSMKKHRWEALPYEPPFVMESLIRFRDMVDHYQISHVFKDKQWNIEYRPEVARKCPEHQIYEHVQGCFICLDN